MLNEYYYNDIPVGKENAVSYDILCVRWGKCKRDVRSILHNLSLYDSGDNYIIIRSSKNGGGFYKTDDIAVIKAYRKECMSKAKSNFAPLKKINRILRSDSKALQSSVFNNLKLIRQEKGLSQKQVVDQMKKYDECFDCPMLSRFENSACLPTPYQLSKLAEIYNVNTNDLVMVQQDILSIYA